MSLLEPSLHAESSLIDIRSSSSGFGSRKHPDSSGKIDSNNPRSPTATNSRHSNSLCGSASHRRINVRIKPVPVAPKPKYSSLTHASGRAARDEGPTERKQTGKGKGPRNTHRNKGDGEQSQRTGRRRGSVHENVSSSSREVSPEQVNPSCNFQKFRGYFPSTPFLSGLTSPKNALSSLIAAKAKET